MMVRAMKTRHRACPEMVGGVGMPLWAERITDCEAVPLGPDVAINCFWHIIVSFLGAIFFGIHSQEEMKGYEHLYIS